MSHKLQFRTVRVVGIVDDKLPQMLVAVEVEVDEFYCQAPPWDRTIVPFTSIRIGFSDPPRSIRYPAERASAGGMASRVDRRTPPC
jgi:hypothetical protein